MTTPKGLSLILILSHKLSLTIREKYRKMEFYGAGDIRRRAKAVTKLSRRLHRKETQIFY